MELRAYAWLKEHAPEAALRVLPRERDVLSRAPLPAGTTIVPAVLEPSGVARRLACALTKGLDLGTVPAHVLAHDDDLVAADPLWRLEAEQLRVLTGDGGLELVEAALLACFPDAVDDLWTLGATLKRIEGVATTALVLVVGDSAERRVEALRGRLEGMLTGAEHVAEDWADSPFLTKVLWSCLNRCPAGREGA